jgi:predicted RNA-binding protein with EMAP domain
MGAQSIKRFRARDVIKNANNSMLLLKRGKIATVCIAVDIRTGEVLAAGIDHSAVARNLKAPEGTWEMKEVPFWR